MRVWLVKANCGDYYCESDHLVAIAAAYEDVPSLVKQAQEERVSRSVGGSYRRWESVEVPLPAESVEIGTLL